MGILWNDGSTGAGILWDDAATSAVPDIQLLWDFDTANIDETVFSVDWSNPDEPVIYLKSRLTTYAQIANNRFAHILYGVSGVAGLRPVFEIDITNRQVEPTYHPSWRPRFSADINAGSVWQAAPSFTPLTSPHRVRFQFADAFTDDTVYIADHQPYTVGMFAVLANQLATDSSGLVSPSTAATASGVIGTSPAEVDERGRAIGENDLYGFVLSSSQPTLDGGPKRWMIVDCAIHSGEVLDGWPLEGIVDFYINGVGSLADRLRANLNIGVYFALTPNGRRGGHIRTNFRTDKDPNRDWAGAGAFALAESVITRDAILSDIGSDTVSVAISLHNDPATAKTEFLYFGSAVSNPGLQTEWLDQLDAVDGVSWDRLPLDIPATVTGWHVSRGARIAVISEFGMRGTNEIPRYRECGQRFLEATAVVDAQGLFYQTEVEVTADTVGIVESHVAIQVGTWIEVTPDTVAITENTIGLAVAQWLDVAPDQVGIAESQVGLGQGVAITVTPDVLAITEAPIGVSPALWLDVEPDALGIIESSSEITAALWLNVTPDQVGISESSLTIDLAGAVSLHRDIIGIAESHVDIQVGTWVDVVPDTLGITEHPITIAESLAITVKPDRVGIAEAPVEILAPVLIDVSPDVIGIDEQSVEVITTAVFVTVNPDSLTITEQALGITLGVWVEVAADRVAILERNVGVDADVTPVTAHTIMVTIPHENRFVTIPHEKRIVG